MALVGQEGAPEDSGLTHLRVRDRILATVNETPLTVWDIAKRLSAHLHQRMAGREIDVATRFAFYARYWPQVLSDCIDRELILADANERSLNTTHAEVREEMEVLFGPDIASSLHRAGLSYEEAFESVKKEITVQRVLLYRAHVPAQQQVGPKLIRQTYHEFAIAQQGDSRWNFRILSIEDADARRGQTTAANLRASLNACTKWEDAQTSIETVAAKVGSVSRVQISEIYSQKDSDLSNAYRAALDGLNSKSWSAPIPYTSKDGQTNLRIFYLEEREVRPCPTLGDSVSKLREILIEQKAAEIAQDYVRTLRMRYGFQLRQIEENIPPDFQPFYLA